MLSFFSFCNQRWSENNEVLKILSKYVKMIIKHNLAKKDGHRGELEWKMKNIS